MQNVPNIISTKDLSYICDMFNWNFTTAKKALNYSNNVTDNEIKDELQNKKTPYDQLSKEYKNYESYIVSMLTKKGVLVNSAIDKEDATYIAWTRDEVISLNEYLNYAIAQNWIDITKLSLDSQYSDSEEILNSMIDYIMDNLKDNCINI